MTGCGSTPVAVGSPSRLHRPRGGLTRPPRRAAGGVVAVWRASDALTVEARERVHDSLDPAYAPALCGRGRTRPIHGAAQCVDARMHAHDAHLPARSTVRARDRAGVRVGGATERDQILRGRARLKPIEDRLRNGYQTIYPTTTAREVFLSKADQA